MVKLNRFRGTESVALSPKVKQDGLLVDRRREEGVPCKGVAEETHGGGRLGSPSPEE